MSKPSRQLVDIWGTCLAVELGLQLFNGVLLFNTPSDVTDATKIAYFRHFYKAT